MHILSVGSSLIPADDFAEAMKIDKAKLHTKMDEEFDKVADFCNRSGKIEGGEETEDESSIHRNSTD